LSGQLPLKDISGHDTLPDFSFDSMTFKAWEIIVQHLGPLQVKNIKNIVEHLENLTQKDKSLSRTRLNDFKLVN